MAAYVSRIMTWIYRLEPNVLVTYAIYSTLVFRAFCRTYTARRWLRPGLAVVLGSWFAWVLWSTLLSRSPGIYESHWVPLGTYWRILQGDTTELLRSALMNVALFFPAGLLTAALLPRGSIRRLVLGFALFSLTIELSQDLFRLGFAEFDDVLHNTLGAMFGYIAFHRDLDLPPAADP